MALRVPSDCLYPFIPPQPPQRISEHSDENGVDATLLGAIFAPLLLKSPADDSPKAAWAAIAGRQLTEQNHLQLSVGVQDASLEISVEVKCTTMCARMTTAFHVTVYSRHHTQKGVLFAESRCCPCHVLAPCLPCTVEYNLA